MSYVTADSLNAVFLEVQRIVNFIAILQSAPRHAGNTFAPLIWPVRAVLLIPVFVATFFGNRRVRHHFRCGESPYTNVNPIFGELQYAEISLGARPGGQLPSLVSLLLRLQQNYYILYDKNTVESKSETFLGLDTTT